MDHLLLSYLSRYFILFMEKFLLKLGSVPSATLESWRNFRVLLGKNPLSLNELKAYIVQMWECDPNLSLEDLERLLDRNLQNQPEPTGKALENVHKEQKSLLSLEKPKDGSRPAENLNNSELKASTQAHETVCTINLQGSKSLSPTSSRKQSGSLETKNPPVLSHFKSFPHFKGDEARPKKNLLNPFLNGLRVETNKRAETQGNEEGKYLKKDSTDLDNKQSPYLKFQSGDFKGLPQLFRKPNIVNFGLKPLFFFQNDSLSKRVHHMKVNFVRHSEIMSTLTLKTFDVCTPKSHDVNIKENFSEMVEIDATSLKKRSIFIKWGLFASPLALDKVVRNSPQEKINIVCDGVPLETN